MDGMKLFGVEIKLHPTFLWMLSIFALFGVLNNNLTLLAWVVVVFVFVVFHELSHSLVARAHGIPVHGIVLLPIGGVARLGALPEDAATEFKIAVAGPALNFVLAGVAYGLFILTVGVSGLLATFFHMALVINLALGTFNLVPAFPMDGGRLLRAYLATRRSYLEATRIAVTVGRWIAGGMVALAVARLFNRNIPVNPVLLILIAVFVYVSGKQEEMAVAARHASRGFWRVFGFGQPGYGQGRGAGPEERPEPGHGHGDVVDVTGHVRRSDSDAADAFRKLGEESDRHLER